MMGIGAHSAVLLLVLSGGQFVSTTQVHLSLSSFEIASGLMTIVEGDMIARTFPIVAGLVTMPTNSRDVGAFLSELELVHKGDGARFHARAASGKSVQVALGRASSSRVEVVLPFTTVITIEVDTVGDPAGEAAISLYSDDVTIELTTDERGRAAVLVEPGEYGIGLTGKSGYVRVDVPSVNPQDSVSVVLGKERD